MARADDRRLVEAFLDLGCADSAPVFAALAALRARHGESWRVVVRHGPPGPRGDGGSACAEAAVAAAQQGLLWRFAERVFAESTPPCRARLLRLARSVGLDAATIEAELWEGRHRTQVQRERERARRLGVDASPAVLVDGRKLGPPARLAARIERLATARRP